MESRNDADTLTILIVQDDRPTAWAWATALQTVGGITVHLTFDGCAALRAIAERRPDIVIVDMGLPHPSGFEIARRSREQSAGKRPFLIAVTGKPDAEFRRRAEASGFDLYLVKPVDFQAILPVFRKRENVVPPVAIPAP